MFALLALIAATTAVAARPAASVRAATPTTYDVTPMVSGDPSPFDIVSGPDGNLWFTVPGSDSVVHMGPGGTLIHTYRLSTGCHPTGITIGPDGNIWAACFLGDTLVRFFADGTTGVYNLPQVGAAHEPALLVAGADGNLWFTEAGLGYVSKLVIATGGVWEFPVPSGRGAGLRGITVGPDGNIWFTEYAANKIGVVTPSGTVTEYPVPTAGAGPFGITSGPNGHLYFTESSGYKIGTVDPSTGAIGEKQLYIPGPLPQPMLITNGPDGNVWFSNRGSSQLGSYIGNSVTVDPSSSPEGIAYGSDGDLWFTEAGAHAVGKVDVRDEQLTVSRTGLTFANVKAGTSTALQQLNFTNFSGTFRFVSASIQNANSYTIGSFRLYNDSCDYMPTPTSGCQLSIGFTANSNVSGTMTAQLVFNAYLQFSAPFTPPDLQTLTVDLTATVLGNTCTSASVSPSLASPQPVGATVLVSATSTGCPDPSPLYRFWVRSRDGAWRIAQDWSTSSGFSWPTAGLPPGVYQLGVWVKDAQSSSTYDSYALTTFQLADPGCTAVDSIAADQTTPEPVGTTITFNTSAVGCMSPLYQWWVRDTVGNWSVPTGHDFAHSSNTFAWSTAGLPAGIYQIGVWARDQQSLNTYDAYTIKTFTLDVSGTTGCAAADLSTDYSPTFSGGGTVTLTANELGCSNPAFMFWIRDPSGTWSILYGWSFPSPPGSTFALAWHTQGVPPGTYQLGVWVKPVPAGSGPTTGGLTYQEYAITTLTIVDNSPCTSVNLSPSAGSPQAPGTAITFTASATAATTACQAEYRFFVAAPGAGFVEAQPYGSSASFGWNTAGLAPGVYQVGVWARTVGSASAYQAYAIASFVLALSGPGTMTWGYLWPSSAAGGNPDLMSLPPQPLGRLVYWNAASSAGNATNVEYQFLVRAPGGAWTTIQGFNPVATAAWNTAGLAPGPYVVMVQIRFTGETAPEVTVVSDYLLT